MALWSPPTVSVLAKRLRLAESRSSTSPNGAAAQSQMLSRDSGTTLGRRPANIANPNGVAANPIPPFARDMATTPLGLFSFSES